MTVALLTFFLWPQDLRLEGVQVNNPPTMLSGSGTSAMTTMAITESLSNGFMLRIPLALELGLDNDGYLPVHVHNVTVKATSDQGNLFASTDGLSEPSTIAARSSHSVSVGLNFPLDVVPDALLWVQLDQINTTTLTTWSLNTSMKRFQSLPSGNKMTQLLLWCGAFSFSTAVNVTFSAAIGLSTNRNINRDPIETSFVWTCPNGLTSLLSAQVPNVSALIKFVNQG